MSRRILAVETCIPFCHIPCLISDPVRSYAAMRSQKIYKVKAFKKEATVDLDVDVTVVGDCRYMFFDEDSVGKDDKMFWCWINTAFVQGGVATFTKNELDDAVKDTKCSNFNKEFKVEFFFRPAPVDKVAEVFDDSEHSDDEKEQDAVEEPEDDGGSQAQVTPATAVAATAAAAGASPAPVPKRGPPPPPPPAPVPPAGMQRQASATMRQGSVQVKTGGVRDLHMYFFRVPEMKR